MDNGYGEPPRMAIISRERGFICKVDKLLDRQNKIAQIAENGVKGKETKQWQKWKRKTRVRFTRQ